MRFATHFLLCLAEACAELSFPRLVKLVEGGAYERRKDEPPLPLHPDPAGVELPS